MTFDEFDVATNEDLSREAKRCFDLYGSPGVGGLDKPQLVLEAQFYLQELGRREDSKNRAPRFFNGADSNFPNCVGASRSRGPGSVGRAAADPRG